MEAIIAVQRPCPGRGDITVGYLAICAIGIKRGLHGHIISRREKRFRIVFVDLRLPCLAAQAGLNGGIIIIGLDRVVVPATGEKGDTEKGKNRELFHIDRHTGTGYEMNTIEGIYVSAPPARVSCTLRNSAISAFPVPLLHLPQQIAIVSREPASVLVST